MRRLTNLSLSFAIFLSSILPTYAEMMAAKDEFGNICWMMRIGGAHLSRIAVDKEGSLYAIEPADEPYQPRLNKITTEGDWVIGEDIIEVDWMYLIRNSIDFRLDVLDIEVDDPDSIMVSGRFYHDVDFCTGNRDEIRSPAGDQGSYFLLCLDRMGKYKWVFTSGESMINGGGGPIEIDGNGDIYFLAYYDGACLTKLDRDGKVIWTRKDFSFGLSLAIDQNGFLIVTGIQEPTVSAAILYPPESPEFTGKHPFIARLDPDGEPLWVNKLNRGYTLTPLYSLAIDDSGAIYFFDEKSGPISTDDTYSSTGYDDFYLCKFSTNGEILWEREWGTSGYDTATGIAIAGNNLVIFGEFTNVADLDPGLKTDIHGVGEYENRFIAGFDTNGNYLWSHSWFNHNSKGAHHMLGTDFGEIESDQEENIFILTESYGHLSFDWNLPFGTGADESGYFEPVLLKLNVQSLMNPIGWRNVEGTYGW